MQIKYNVYGKAINMVKQFNRSRFSQLAIAVDAHQITSMFVSSYYILLLYIQDRILKLLAKYKTVIACMLPLGADLLSE